MRLVHGTDDLEQDRKALWKNRLLEAVCLAIAVLIVAVYAWLVLFEHSKNGLMLLGSAFLIGLMLYCFREAAGKNSSYCVTKNGVQKHTLFRTRKVSWDAINGYGVYGVLTNYGRPTSYIALFLSGKRYAFPLGLEQCSARSKDMIVIRYTEERFRELSAPLEACGVVPEHMIPAERPEAPMDEPFGDDAYRLVHGVDERVSDACRLWMNRCMLSLFILSLAGLSVVFVMFVRSPWEPTMLLLYGLLLVSFCIVLGLAYYAVWRNRTYRLTSDGLEIHSALGTSCISWDKMTGYGVYPVLHRRNGAPRPYIVLWRTRERLDFPLSIESCSWHESQMIVIRYTDERLRKIAAQLDKRGIRRETTELSDYL